MTFQFTPAATYNLAATSFTLNVQPYSVLWYNSSASQAYGGLFRVTVPFAAQASSAGAPCGCSVKPRSAKGSPFR